MTVLWEEREVHELKRIFATDPILWSAIIHDLDAVGLG